MGKKTVLIFGGAGFIGSQTNKMLQEAGYRTVVFDNLSTGKKSTVVAGDFFEGDIGNTEDLEAVFTRYKIDSVMHFAAKIKVGESVEDPSAYYTNNVAYTLNLLDVMLRCNIKTLIFSSSASVYGIPETIPIPETHPTRPINPYGRSKLFVEEILKDYEKAYGLQYISLRYFNAAGGDPDGVIKNGKQEESNLIPLAFRSIINNQSLPIYGTDYPTCDGTCIRDYIHVYDLGAAHIAAMEKLFEGGSSSFYNLGNGKGFSVRQVLEAVEKVSGKKLNTTNASRREGDPSILIADSNKAKKELHWTPVYPSLHTIVSDAWNSFPRNIPQHQN